MEDLSEMNSALIRYVCTSGVHQAIGRSVPDGGGLLTIYRGAWAYCASARPNEPHDWTAVQGMSVRTIRHERGRPGVARTVA